MTNREKYIDKASNEELSKLLASKCFITATDKITYNVFGKGKENDLHSIKKWLSKKVEKIADELFMKLGYAEPSQEGYTVKYRSSKIPYVEIRLHKNVYNEWEYEKYYVDKQKNLYESVLITKAEDKAIHKKIEELKRRETK